MRIAYIAGPYRARTIFGVILNIIRARRVALKYWKKGYAVICPHSNTALFDGKCPDDTWLKGDIEMLGRCDLVVMMKGWQRSKGATAEKVYASLMKIETVYE